jgi:hypothetical protein
VVVIVVTEGGELLLLGPFFLSLSKELSNTSGFRMISNKLGDSEVDSKSLGSFLTSLAASAKISGCRMISNKLGADVTLSDEDDS